MAWAKAADIQRHCLARAPSPRLLLCFHPSQWAPPVASSTAKSTLTIWMNTGECMHVNCASVSFVHKLAFSLTLWHICFVAWTQSCDSPQGTRQDASQKPSFDRVGMAWYWCATKPWLATLCHSPVSPSSIIVWDYCLRTPRPSNGWFSSLQARTPHSLVPPSSGNRSSKRTCRPWIATPGSWRIPRSIWNEELKPFGGREPNRKCPLHARSESLHCSLELYILRGSDTGEWERRKKIRPRLSIDELRKWLRSPLFKVNK